MLRGVLIYNIDEIYVYNIIYIYLEPNWPLFFESQPSKTRPKFQSKLRVLWVLGIYYRSRHLWANFYGKTHWIGVFGTNVHCAGVERHQKSQHPKGEGNSNVKGNSGKCRIQGMMLQNNSHRNASTPSKKWKRVHTFNAYIPKTDMANWDIFFSWPTTE